MKRFLKHNGIHRSPNGGFSLIEILTVLAILIVLIGLGGAGINYITTKSRNTSRNAAKSNLEKYLASYYSEYQIYPNQLGEISSFEDLVLASVPESEDTDQDEDGFLGTYLNGSWDPGAPNTIYCYKTNKRATLYSLCVSQKKIGGQEFDCSGPGVENSGWPNKNQNSCKSDCGICSLWDGETWSKAYEDESHDKDKENNRDRDQNDSQKDQKEWKLKNVNDQKTKFQSQNTYFNLDLGSEKETAPPQVEFSLNEQLGNQELSFKLLKIGKLFDKEKIETNPQVIDDGKSLFYKDIAEGVDVKYSIIPNKGIKEEIVLNKPSEEDTFEFELGIEGLTAATDSEGIWRFYDDNDNEIFFIPEPYMVDAEGAKSRGVDINIKDNKLIISIDSSWTLSPDRKFPIKIDPTVELNIMTLHSHPLAGDEWSIEFETVGQQDLRISPDDQATIDDIDFVSLKCGDTEREAVILKNDVIFYEDWECDKTAELKHFVKVANPHRLKFEFGSEIDYAYNAPGSTTYTFSGITQFSGPHNSWTGVSSYDLSMPLYEMTIASDTDYDNIEADDGIRLTTAKADEAGEFDVHLFRFQISENISDITELDLRWNGYGETESGYDTELYIYNDYLSQWEGLDGWDFTSATDLDLDGNITGNIDEYIDSSKLVNALVRTRKAPFCSVSGDYNSTTTLDGDVVYCDADGDTMWTITAPDQYSFSQALNYCQNLTYGGYDDWQVSPCFCWHFSSCDLNICPIYDYGIDNCGWTQSVFGDNSQCTPAWDPNAAASGYGTSQELFSGSSTVYVDFSDSSVDVMTKTGDHYIRCYRNN